MKRLLCLLLAATALGSCSRDIRYTLSGQIEGADSVYLATADGQGTLIASAPVAKDGSFRFKGHVALPTVAQLTDAEDILTVVFLEKGDLALEPGENGGYQVTGSVSNDRFNTVNQELNDIQTEFYALGPDTPESEHQTLYSQFNSVVTKAVTDNLDNLLGAYLFAMREYSEMGPQEIRARLAQFTPEMQQTTPLLRMARMAAALEKTEVGQPYTELILPDTAGRSVALSSLMGQGKWVLIDFWATWCGPCRDEMPYLKEAYERYHDKGFTIYAVSIDDDADAWYRSVAADNPAWPNVIAMMVGPDAAMDLYAIRSVPTNFLIGPNGTIVARNLRGEELKNKLTEFIQ